MNNNLFRQATALMVGSLVAVSGQALAFSVNSQELSRVKQGGDSELLIAQESGVGVAVAIGVAVEAMCQVKSVVRTVAIKQEIPPQFVPIVKNALNKAVGAAAKAQTQAKKTNNSNVVQAIATVVSSLDNAAQAVATGDAGTAQVQVTAAVQKGNQAIVQAGGQAKGGCSP